MGRPRLFTTEQAAERLRTFQRRYGCAPTIAEFTDYLGVGSTRTTMRYLRRMEKAGYVQRFPGARGMRIADAKELKRSPKKTVMAALEHSGEELAAAYGLGAGARCALEAGWSLKRWLEAATMAWAWARRVDRG